MGVRQSCDSAPQSASCGSELVTLKPVRQRQVRALHRHQKKNLRCTYTPPPPPPTPTTTPTAASHQPLPAAVSSETKKKQKKNKEEEPKVDQRERTQDNYDDFRRYLTLNEKDTSLCLTVTTIRAEKIIETRPKDFSPVCDSDGEEDEDAGWTVVSKTPLPERKRKTFRFERYPCYNYHQEYYSNFGDEEDQQARREFFTNCRHMGPSNGFQCMKKWKNTTATWEWDKESRDFENDEKGMVLRLVEIGDTSISQDGPAFDAVQEEESIFDGITNFESIPETYNSSYYEL